MKRTLALLAKLLLLVSLVLASLPSGATETVCVMDGGRVVLPVARCGMPCCAGHRAVAPEPAKRSCCLPKSLHPGGTTHRCASAGSACRCETRLAAAPAARVATVDSKAAVPVESPAVLPAPLPAFLIPNAALREPGVRGVDPGPPRKRPRNPSPARAPPVPA